MFGGFGNNNNNSTQGGGLFSKSNTPSTGLGFGNSNNTQQPASGFGNNNTTTAPNSLFGNNNNTTSNGLFGNTNTNNTTPSPGGLFGNSNNNTNTTGGLFGAKRSASSNPSSIFGSNTASSLNANGSTGGLFGSNTSSTATTDGLFGNNNSSTPSSGGLFGNNSSTSTTGGLFGKPQTNTTGSSLFGKPQNATTGNSLFGSSNQQSTGLFSNGGITQQQPGSLFGSNTLQNNSSIGTPPAKQYNVKDLPKSLTDSATSNKIIQHSSNARKRSLSSAASNNIAPVGRSSILERLGRSNTLRVHDAYDSEGLFTSKKDIIQSATSPEKSKDTNKRVTPRVFSTSSKSVISRAIRARNNFSSDYLKLKVDTGRTEARRLVLFGSTGGAQKVRILGRDDEPQTVINHIEDEKPVEEEINTVNEEIQEANEVPEEANNTVNITENDDYWCSPSIEELSKLQLRQLYDVSDFTIGRKGYGSIAFELPVDLTAFWADLPGYLFGNIVRFSKNKTVEVYPNGSVPLGTGLNVPATITLEKVFPISKSKAQSKDLETRLFVKKLKEFKDMQFVTYDPINGSWTFRVKHFSIWGLVDDDAAVVDVDAELESVESTEIVKPEYENVAQLPRQSEFKNSTNTNSKHSVEDTFIYKKQRESSQKYNSSVMPGSFFADDSLIIMNHEDNDYDEQPANRNILSDEHNDLKESSIVLDSEIPHQSTGDESFIYDVPDDEDIDEKQFEPEDVDDEDFNILEAAPTLLVDDNWDRQLELSSLYNSVFADNSLARSTIQEGPFSKGFTPGELDKLLFGDFEKIAKSQNKIKNELRLSNYNFASFTSSNKLLIKDGSSKSTSTIKPVSSLFGNQNKELLQAIYREHLKQSHIVQRSNGFPKVAPNQQLNFKFITQVSDSLDISIAKDIWELASILFDDFSHSPGVEVNDVAVSNRILEIKRREGLSQWLKNQIQAEVETRFEETADIFEQIFLLLVTFEIPSAAKLAVKTNNPHLAVLISLLGSNDPEVKFSATKQVDYWKKNAILQTIPHGLLKIYYLLQGDVLNKDPYVNLSDNLSWKAKLGLLLSFGDLNQPLNSLLSSFIASETINPNGPDSSYLALLKLYIHKYVGKDGLQKVFTSIRPSGTLDATAQWFIFEILVRSTNQVTLGPGSVVIGDKLTTLFAEELLSFGLYEEAIFILLHLNNDEEAKSVISRIITVNIGLFSTNDDLIERLIQELNVPAKSLLEAKALYFRFNGRPWEEVSALLDAENYQEAHKTIIDKVAPNAVINNGTKLDELHALINRFPEQYSIKDWAIGLAVYKNYIQFIKTKSDGPLKYLVEHVPLVQQTNYKVKVAVRLISKAIALRLLDVSKKGSRQHIGLNSESILNLPLGEDLFFFDKQLKMQSFSKKEMEVL